MDGAPILDVFPTGPIQANCIVLGDPATRTAAVIDPGDEAERIVARAEALKLTITHVLHTHGHLDHAGGTADLCRRLGREVPVGLHRDELELYNALPTQASMFGMEVEAPPQPTLWLEHGATLTVGEIELEIRHTPGHSPGGVCFIIHRTVPPAAIVGDVLFSGSIGRTDLWGGSLEILEQSIRSQLYTLDNTTRVICGHGPDTTVGRERAGNPFVRDLA
jgi:hydroxyacylglutathione hydrolase